MPTRPPASSAAALSRMRRQRRSGTGPELALRRAAFRLGLRYRIDYPLPVKGLRRRADFAFPSIKIAVFVDGCFWHRCPIHSSEPRANADWWRAKLDANVERDRDTDRRLREIGWEPCRIWEHEDVELAAERLLTLVMSRRSERVGCGMRRESRGGAEG